MCLLNRTNNEHDMGDDCYELSIRAGLHRSLRLENGLTVHLSAVANPHHKDCQSAIFNTRNNPVVAYAILPEFAQARSLQGFTNAAGVIQRCDSFIQKREDSPGNLRV